MKRIVVFGVVIVLILAVVLIAVWRDASETPSSKIMIAASFYIPAEFAKQVGKDRVDVASITPSGVKPHEYEPTPGEIANVYSADLFIFQGSGFDPWAERLDDNLRARGKAVVSIMGSLASDNSDSHIWLDPVMARREVEIVRDALIEIDPAGAVFYRENSSEYINALSLLDEEYKKGLAECAKKDFVVSHSAFEYIARRYGLSPSPMASWSPEEEPSPRKIAEIVELVRANDIKFIFTEPNASSQAAETIARETGAEILILNPIESLTAQDAAAGEDYVSLMKNNLKNLRRALKCK